MAPKSVTFRRHDHLVSVLFEDLLSHSYNITFSMFLDLVAIAIHLLARFCFQCTYFGFGTLSSQFGRYFLTTKESLPFPPFLPSIAFDISLGSLQQGEV